MSGKRNRSISESLVLDDTEDGVVIAGITDDKVAAKSGLQKGDEIVAATIHLDHLNKSQVLNILKVLEPYDNNIKVLTKKELDVGSLGLDLKNPAEMLNLKKDLSLDAQTKAPVVSLNGLDGNINAGQGVGGGISLPTLNGNLPSLNLDKPSADTGGNFALPSVGLTGPDLKGDFRAPDVKLNTPSVDIEKPEIKTGDAKFKAPKFTMPHFNVPTIKSPDADLSGDLDLKTPNLSVSGPDLNPQLDLKTSDVKLETPNVDLNAPSGNIKWPHQTWQGPKFKGLNADLNGPDASLSTPKIDGDLSTPNLDVNLPKAGFEGPNVDVKTPNVDFDPPSSGLHLPWKMKKPKFNTPKSDLDLDANLKGPDVNLSAPNLEAGINAPDINLPKADLKSPNVDLQAPTIDADASSGRWGWLPWNWNKPKYHTPKADLDIKADKPDLNLSAPKIDGGINGPDLNLPKAGLTGPDLDADLNPPSGKMNWPHHKWKKPRLHGLKGDLNADYDASLPNIDGNINGPGLNLPKAGLKGPGLDVDGPDLDIDPPSGKFPWPHKKWKKPVLNGPKVDVNTPDLSLPRIDGNIDGPDVDVSLPKAELPDANLEGHSSKIRFPTLKKPKWAFSGPKVNGPDVDLDAGVSAPDLNLKAPKIDGELKAPNANLDINAPNIEVPSGGPKFPTLKKPKWAFSGPKVNGPDVDLDAGVSAPDLNLKAPKIDGELKAPNANLDINAPNIEVPSGGPKFPTLKKPKWAFSGPKVNGPDVDLDADVSAPDLSLKAPKIDGGLKAPDANLDINAPDVEGPSGFFKGLKLPKFGPLKGPKADIDADLNTPDLNLSGPKIDGGIGTPGLDVNLPSTNLSGPNVNIDNPDLKLDSPDGKLKLPKFRLPNLRGPKVKGPEFDADLDSPNINVDLPKADLSAPNIKGGLDAPNLGISGNKPGFKLPGFNIGGPKAQLPDAELSGLKGPDLNLSAPSIKGDLSTPNLNLDTDLNRNVDLKAPKSNFSLPNVDLNLPKADLKAPDAQLKTPDLDVDSSLGDFKLPHFKLPKFGAPDAKVEVPTADANISVPSVDLSGPKVGADIGAPKVDLKAPNVDANVEKSKLPHFKLPKFNLGSNAKAPEVDADANLEVPDLKLKAPTFDGGISSPGVNLSGPEVGTSLNKPNLGISADADVDIKGSPKSKLRWPFKWGRKSVSGDDEGIGINSEIDGPNADLEVPAFKFHRLPTNSSEGSGGTDDTLGLAKLNTEAKDYVVSKGVRLPIINSTSKSGEKVDIFERLRMAKEKAPSPNTSPTDSRGEIDLKLPTPSFGVNTFTEGADASLVRGGTFKVEKPDSILDLAAPTISTKDENDKMSLSLSNMLGLNIKDSD